MGRTSEVEKLKRAKLEEDTGERKRKSRRFSWKRSKMSSTALPLKTEIPRAAIQLRY